MITSDSLVILTSDWYDQRQLSNLNLDLGQNKIENMIKLASKQK